MERAALTFMRKVWGFYDLFSALPQEMQVSAGEGRQGERRMTRQEQANVLEANKSVDVDAFDLILSKVDEPERGRVMTELPQEKFPEMFVSPFDYCNVCQAARAMVHAPR